MIHPRKTRSRAPKGVGYHWRAPRGWAQEALPPSGSASGSERRGVVLPGKPAGQGNAALAGGHRAGAGGQAASPSVCAVGGLRASIPLAVRYRRIVPITLGSVMNAMIRMVAPQRGQTRGSTSKIRRMSCAQRRRRARASASLGTGTAGGDGTTSVPALPAAAVCRARRALATLEYAP